MCSSDLPKMSKILQDTFKTAANKADRLVRTEANFVLNQAEAECYENEGNEEYEYLAVIDSRTSDICRGLNSKRFKVKDKKVGVNYPPMHPYCRSTTIPVINTNKFNKDKENIVDKDKEKSYYENEKNKIYNDLTSLVGQKVYSIEITQVGTHIVEQSIER